jgi:hypothetical protein
MLTDELKNSFLSVNPISESENSSPDCEAISSQLDTKSTSDSERPPDSYRELILRTCQQEYDAVFDAYEAMFAVKKQQRLDDCRRSGWFMREIATGAVRVSANSCHVRGCPMCAAAKSNRVAVATSEYLANQPDAKFLTLTMKHTDLPLGEQIDKLNKDFRAFRRLKEISNRVKGGFWFLEIKKGKDDLWHIHLHCLVVSAWIAKEELSRLWLKCTGESYIIDIRKIKDAQAAAKYAAKYASKPAELRYFSLTERVELLEETKNVRTHGAWGVIAKAKLLAKPVYVASNWQRLGSWLVVCRLKNHDLRAAAILSAWKNNESLDDSYAMDDIEDFIADRVPFTGSLAVVDDEPPDKLLF